MDGGTRDLDVVLLGATGYVGRLTAQHLARHTPDGVRVALAGRSLGRLTELRAGLDARAREWPLLVVDATEAADVAALAHRTRVVATTVGPYLRYGLPLVQACADAGTSYADLTGETLFVRRSVDSCHVRAGRTGARIVHSCGFDSVPSDLGVGLLAALAAADGRGRLGATTMHVRSLHGGISGGTIDSLRQQVVEVSGDPQLRRLVADPWCLAGGRDPAAGPSPASRGGRRSSRSVALDPRTGRWETPFALGGFNRQIVQRSNALSLDGYGPDFRYREVVDTGRGASGAVKAAALATGTTALMAGMWFRPTRTLLDRALPVPGQGPAEQRRSRGRFRLETETSTADGGRYVTRFGADLDPGYGATAVMLGESALCLALDELSTRAGVLTPMVAMGEQLAARLRRRDFSITTERLGD